MAFNAENKLVIPLEVMIWLICTAIAIGSYLVDFDIGFWLKLITWGVFLLGIAYFILLVLAEIFGW